MLASSKTYGISEEKALDLLRNVRDVLAAGGDAEVAVRHLDRAIGLALAELAALKADRHARSVKDEEPR